MNCYEVFGVDKKESVDNIKKIFRKLVKENHPDKGGDGTKLQELYDAWEILGNEEKKKAYDKKLNLDLGFSFNEMFNNKNKTIKPIKGIFKFNNKKQK